MNNLNFGFGKSIFLGEHFVVHGLPALVAALPLKTYASVKPNAFGKLILIDDRPKVPDFVPNKTSEYLQMIENILVALKIKQRNFTITVYGDLPVTCGGIGSSAACAVAISKAFNHHFNLCLKVFEINEVALFAESAVHGQPSGVDNSAANFGGFFMFSKNGGIIPINLINPIKILLVDSGQRTDTKALIHKVKSFLDEKSGCAAGILALYNDIFERGVCALKIGDFETLGRCMIENHLLLKQIGVSCSKLDFIVDVAIKKGAFGAKLTGTGGGGLALILTSDDVQEKMAKEFQSYGFFTKISTIGSTSLQALSRSCTKNISFCS